MRIIRMKKILGLIFICLMFSGCARTSANPTEYEFNTDMQYYQIREANKVSLIQNYDCGCYLVHDGFIYQADVKDRKIIPLCDKVNCLHDQETDAAKRSECNAFLSDGMISSVSLMLNGDYLYVCFKPHSQNDPSKTVFGSIIIRVSSDGHSKDVFHEFEEEIKFIMAHRGYLYCYCSSYILEEEGVKTGLSIQRLSIRRKNNEPEAIFSVPDGYHDLGYGFLQAYGKYVYFDLHYSDDSETHSSLFIYDTETGKAEEHEELGHCSFYEGKLYFHDYVDEEGDEYPTSVYRTDLDGGNREVVFEGVPQGYYVVGDEKYLYLNNAMLVSWGNEEQKRYWVYDRDMNPVDEFTVPDTDMSYLDPPIGGTDSQYEICDDPDTGEWGVLVWDKSKIGSYHGAAYEQERIVYGVK